MRILKKYDKITYNELPFKSIISDIRSILPKKGCKTIKKGIKYVEEIKELTSLQIENCKNNLTKLRNDLIETCKKNNRTKKADKEYYEYEDNKFNGLKDIRNLFDQNDYNDDVCEEIEYLFNEIGLEYKEIKKLMSIKAKKEYISVIHGRIEQEEAIEYRFDYCEVNYYEYEHKQEVDCIKLKPCLIDSECIVCEIIEDQKVEYCELIEG